LIISIPYKASPMNIIAIKETFESNGTTLKVGEVALAAGVKESLTCRMMGPVNVSPGKTVSQYIKEAMDEELLLAGVYSTKADVTIIGEVTELSFSSISPANWEISMNVLTSENREYYSVRTKYEFNTSWDAWSACKNVANAFSPAVQELIRQVVTHPNFSKLSQ
jgi:hypothetical protein